jgi:hypothetical protein
MKNLDDFNEFLNEEEVNEMRNLPDATTRDLASKVIGLFYNTEFWRFRESINLVIKRHYNRKTQIDESLNREELNEAKVKLNGVELRTAKWYGYNYPLKDGNKLYVWEEVIRTPGVGGKATSTLNMCLEDGTVVSFEDVEEKLEMRHALDIEGTIDDIEVKNKKNK